MTHCFLVHAFATHCRSVSPQPAHTHPPARRALACRVEKRKHHFQISAPTRSYRAAPRRGTPTSTPPHPRISTCNTRAVFESRPASWCLPPAFAEAGHVSHRRISPHRVSLRRVSLRRISLRRFSLRRFSLRRISLRCVSLRRVSHRRVSLPSHPSSARSHASSRRTTARSISSGVTTAKPIRTYWSAIGRAENGLPN